MVEYIKNADMTLAILVRADHNKEGIEFFTPNDFSQQLAYMNRPKGYYIQPHTHNFVPRKVNFTQEVLFVKSGKVRIDFFDDDRQYLESRILNTGDVILLAHGGHGIKMIEESEIIEVKQGPYTGEQDKTRFGGPGEQRIETKLK
jgi:hypothetical protein